MKRLSSIILIFSIIFLSHTCFAGFDMRDEFTSALSAGSVNGSACEPNIGGSCTRTVTDTENKLSIADGKLTFSGGKASPAYGDPAIWFPAVTRTAGKMGIFQFKPTSATLPNPIFLGFDTDTSGYSKTSTYWYNESLRIYPVKDGSSVPVVTSLSNNTDYYLATVLRTAGSFAYIKGGVFTNWTLLWHTASATDNDATLYPYISNYNATADFSYLRIPTTLWLPTPLAYSTFASGITVTETTGPDSGYNPPALTWTSGASTWSASGSAVNTPVAGSELATGTLTIGTWYSITATEENHFYTGCAIGHTFRATGETALDANNKVKALTLNELPVTVSVSTPDVIATTAVTLSAGTQAGLVLNLDSTSNPQNFILAYHDGTYAKLDKCVAGTYTNVISAAATYSAGAELRVIKDGTTYRLYYNNVLIGSASTISDAGIINNTRHGLFSTYSGNSLDNFSLYARGTSGEYGVLEKLMNAGGAGGNRSLMGVGY